MVKKSTRKKKVDTPNTEPQTLLDGTQVEAPEDGKLPELTTPEAWRQVITGTYRLRLPTGQVIRARRIDIGQALMDGVVTPKDLTQIQNVLQIPIEKRFQKMMPLARKLVPEVVLHPKLTLKPSSEPDSVCVDDVPSMDLFLVFMWAWAGLPTLPAYEEK
jgi:hypothetical protein